MSTLTAPYPAELMRIARKVVWYDAPEATLGDLKTFLAHLMVYGSPADVEVVVRHVSMEEFRKVLTDAPAGVFTTEAWVRWHEKFGLEIPPLPRRRFPDGSLGPDPGAFFGRLSGLFLRVPVSVSFRDMPRKIASVMKNAQSSSRRLAEFLAAPFQSVHSMRLYPAEQAG